MRLRVVFVLGSILLGCARPQTMHANMAQPRQSPRAIDFEARLYDVLRAQPGNLFFSPASIRAALTLTYGGARDETAQELRDALRLPAGDAAQAEMADRLRRWLDLGNDGAAKDGAQLRLHLANRLWARHGLPLEPRFVTLARDRYGATIGELDFDDPSRSLDAIDTWVSHETDGTIPRLLSAGDIATSTRLMLVNAIYFKATWTNPFDPRFTQAAPFFGATPGLQAQLMLRRSHFAYAEFPGGQLLELMYGKGAIVLDVLLPATPDGLPRLEQQLVDGALPGWLASLRPENVAVALPRFHATWRANLTASLRALGITRLFSADDAQLSGIVADRPLNVSQIVHQAVLAVDERGSEAAAASGVLITSELISNRHPEAAKSFRADHPFVFVIRVRDSDEILFMGRLVTPDAP